MTSLFDFKKNFNTWAPACEYWTLRLVEEKIEQLTVRRGVVEPCLLNTSRGAMITAVEGSGIGYGATCELNPAGLRAAGIQASNWARIHAKFGLFDAQIFPRTNLKLEYRTPIIEPWENQSVADKILLLQQINQKLTIDEKICDWSAWLTHRRVEQLFLTSDGGQIFQVFEYVDPGLSVIASNDKQTQRRRGKTADGVRQGGLELIATVNLLEEAERVATEALELLDAPECPSDTRDLILLPSQMVLQIHESIGHPLELDRILGDERNYAGASFVTPEMFGNYRYGSELLTVTFDPTVAGETVSCGADDEGNLAQRCVLIKKGRLERPLGGPLSQSRARLSGTSNVRASSWDRPPIDRMGNLNLEPGLDSLDSLIAQVERGILMDTNRSWSIDDCRNKFQFGCEWGRLIEDGRLKNVVRNPGYRGISAQFWRSLAGVGNSETFEIRGVKNCGKGEPNQGVYVGHATPPALFKNVAIFGGGR